MKPLYIRYHREKFWDDYWREFKVDRDEFIDLKMYPIGPALRQVTKGQRILECGFGAGRVLRHLAKHGHEIYGLEYSRSIVEQLKDVDPKLQVMAGDIRSMPFADGTFDLALCFGVIGGLEAAFEPALMELRRVVKPGGVIVASVMKDNFARKAHKFLSRFSSAPWNFYAWTDSTEGWRNYFSSKGFQVIDAEEMVKRYNLYYWTTFLRGRRKTNLELARINDAEYSLNPAGELLWFLHRTVLRSPLSAGVTYALKV